MVETPSLSEGQSAISARNPTYLERLKARVRRQVSLHPSIYLPIRNRRKPGTTVTSETDLVIEGFPRCGNTWTENAIRCCAADGIKLAHHSHAFAHVKAAVSRGIATLVVYREPDDAVRSLLVARENRISPLDAFDDFSVFYENVMRLPTAALILASFDDVTQRMGTVVEHLNRKFALGLRPFDDGDPQQKQAVFDLMDQKARERRPDQLALSRCNPNHYGEKQAQLKDVATSQIEAPANSAARRRAKQVFTRLQSLDRQ